MEKNRYLSIWILHIVLEPFKFTLVKIIYFYLFIYFYYEIVM